MRWCVFAGLLLSACGSDGAVVRVDVRTDWVPGVEFTEVELSVDDAPPVAVRPASVGENFIAGVRIAELDALPAGRTSLRVRLLAADGRRIAQKGVVIVGGSSSAVTIVLTRNCANVSCPAGDPDATECLDGRCVSPECSPESPASCGEGCAEDGDCDASPVGCATAVCLDRTCLLSPEPDGCGASEVCHPETGCVPRPDGRDGGTGGMLVCGEACSTGNLCETGIVVCEAGGEPTCESDALLAAGTSCRPARSECDLAEVCDGESATCPGDLPAPVGTECDGGFCDATGACSTDCTPGASCSTGNPCERGVVSCAGGVPACEVAGPADAGVACREAAGACDAPEVCDGMSTECPDDRRIDAGTECNAASGPCDVAEVCDGSSPACPMDAFRPTGTACPDGFCDGLGVCSSGCTPGAACSTGDPCEVGAIDCGTGSPTCVRSGNAPNGTSCGATENGGWGSCGSFSGTCDQTGTQSRDVTTYACSTGSCRATTAPETRSCSRNTDGTSCGTTMTGSWASCGGFSSTCDESGTQSRDVTTYACAGGSCGGTTVPESRSCTRTTNGTTCGTTMTGSWSSCGGFSTTCDETGTQSRPVTTYTCASSSCGTNSSSETRSCTRSTNGSSCGSVTYGGWGACGGFSSACDTTGTRTRDEYTPTCGSGSCNTVTTTDTGSCSRTTQGNVCGTVTYGGWGACGGFTSTCDETGTETRDVYTPTCNASQMCSNVTTTESRSCSRSTTGTVCGSGIPNPCSVRRCSSGSCIAAGDNCPGGQHCCEFGCQPLGTSCP